MKKMKTSKLSLVFEAKEEGECENFIIPLKCKEEIKKKIEKIIKDYSI